MAEYCPKCHRVAHVGICMPPDEYVPPGPPGGVAPNRGRLGTSFLPNAMGAILLVGGGLFVADALSPENLHSNGGSYSKRNTTATPAHPVHRFTLYRKRGEYEIFAATGKSNDRHYESQLDCHKAKNPNLHCELLETVSVTPENVCWAADIDNTFVHKLVIGFGKTKQEAVQSLDNQCRAEGINCMDLRRQSCAPAP